ncbi:MAG: T9SS type A sorting domain-containing protein [Bacteroidota bacterium]|nr:T9SS type A sorting domain-containing protein [Bacteroidota bacterium]
MKKFTLLITLLLFVVCSFAQKITRGPDVGEIYFLGPTTTILQGAIYHSTDFGETAICMDSVSALSNTLVAMTADKTPGSLYFSTMGGLYYSDSYGNYNTWTLHQGGISNKINSGRNDGEIFNRIGSHSINYGLNFTTHSCQGFFGSTKAAEIDNSNDIAYCISYDYEINDTLFFFISYNNYDNLEVKHKFNFHWSNEVFISRENDAGTLFLCNTTLKELYFSDNYGESWTLKNLFTCPNLPIKGITGGRQDGELYLLVEYLQMMGQRRHVYIYHSLDYGETFTIYHPVSIGPDPIYANFTAIDTLVEPGDTVQFTDLSNDAETWEWDFNNDGLIDSYEKNPTHIYQDTGYYTVKLSISGAGGIIQDYGIRNNYIHVKNLTSISNKTKENIIIVYPVPSKNHLTIESKSDITGISIFDLNGLLIEAFYPPNFIEQNKLIALSFYHYKSGVYLIKIETAQNSHLKKIVINH